MKELEAIRELARKWKRWSKVDCDPANGSSMTQIRGRAVGECADELEALLPALAQQIDAHDVALLKPLERAAGVFAFDIPYGVADELQVGTIQNIPVYAGEIRRLNAALKREKRGGE